MAVSGEPAVLSIAIAGDLHDQWDAHDHRLLLDLAPDAVLVVGDLSDGTPRTPSLLTQLPLPMACVLGNHDTGRDCSGRTFQRQIDLLGERHCGWSLRQLTPPGLAVVGARPGTAGGGFTLSRACLAALGPVTLQDSADRTTQAALAADPAMPLVLLSHSGPTGLGSDPGDPCGCDWKHPACDWGDQDLALAIRQIQCRRPLPLVVFGHMHHQLMRGQGERRSFQRDRAGTAYLNAACVPRHIHDEAGVALRHFSWVEFVGLELQLAAHRWYDLSGRLRYEERLYTRAPTALVLC